MMFCFHILIVLTLIIIQTTFIPYHALFQSLYDLSIVFVIYLGLYRPLREGIPMVIFLGFIMDSLSGSPLGMYTISYAWIYGGCFWFLTFLQAHNHLFLIAIVAVAVVVENIIFIKIHYCLDRLTHLHPHRLDVFSPQKTAFLFAHRYSLREYQLYTLPAQWQGH